MQRKRGNAPAVDTRRWCQHRTVGQGSQFAGASKLLEYFENNTVQLFNLRDDHRTPARFAVLRRSINLCLEATLASRSGRDTACTKLR